MSTVADISVPVEEFVLSDTISDVGGRISVEGIVALSDVKLTPYLRVVEVDFKLFEDALAQDSTAADYDVFSTADDERCYRIEWENLPNSLLSAIDRVSGAVTQAECTDQRWRLRVRFPDREALSRFYDGYRRELSVTLDRVFAAADHENARRDALSADQREALLTALERGYFEVPRAATQRELAVELGISSQSVSQRLRRGQRNLLRNTLAAREPIP